MANLPAVKEPEPLAKLRKSQRLAADFFADGMTITTVSNAMSKRYGKTPRQWRRVIRRWLVADEMFQTAIANISQAELIGGTPRVTRAVVNRAGRGNPNMARLALEASGFHNPRVDHKHSGEVKITLSGIPRPTAGPDETPPIVDAEVVD